MSRLILGTASFGADYGATNSRGEVLLPEIRAILSKCRRHGIRHLDTAQLYGRAEEKLGEAGVDGFAITTKLRLEPGETADALEVKLRSSLGSLRTEKVDTLLLHSDEMFKREDAGNILEALHRLVELGLIQRWGLSSYEPAEALGWCRLHGLRVVQLPASALDGRLFENGLLDQFQAEGVEVQIRSVFLQGVLIGKPRKGTSIPRLVLDEAALFRAKCKKQGLDPLGAAMAQILRASPDPKIVIGVTGVDELDAILCSLADAQAPANYDPPPWRREFDPRTWCH